MIFSFASCLGDDTRHTVRRWTWDGREKNPNFFTSMTKLSHRHIFASLLNVLKWIWVSRAFSDDRNPFLHWNFLISLTAEQKTHLHSFPHRFRCNQNEADEEKCKNMLTALSGKTSITFSLSLALASSILHHELFSYLFCPATVAGVFFISCLVKAQVRSALNSVRWKNKFSESFLRALSSLLTLYLLELDDFLLLIVVAELFVCAAFDANLENRKVRGKFSRLCFLAKRFFRVWWPIFLYDTVINVPWCQLNVLTF